MSNYGITIKSIRKNKGYTQKEVAANLFTQATYSNFEAAKTDILSFSFMHLLSQLQISSEELMLKDSGVVTTMLSGIAIYIAFKSSFELIRLLQDTKYYYLILTN
ncbi:helix-turn-helix domain-containing protein [Solibacillus sp. FSL W7-1324]|uniref:helix-turn-helix domain-containing protein n=1 Tax=Solibacillus sp. FSL W7-1324 TaxID=2921701 RepID=UPI0030F5E86C